MTQDLHVWYEQNLVRDRTNKPMTAQGPKRNGHASPTAQETPELRTFQLSIAEADVPSILCTNSAFSDGWLAAFSAHPSELPNFPLFTCWCRKQDGPLALDHSRALEAFLGEPFPASEP